MNKIGIITITDNTNYGNRLQNYAVEKILEKYGFKVETIWEKNNKIKQIKDFFKNLIPIRKKWSRHKKIKQFTENYTKMKVIDSYKNLSKYCNDFDYIIVGSDQIWNLKWQLNRNKYLLDIPSNKIISFSASFGISSIRDELFEWYSKIINHVSHISVREYSGKKIINEVLKIDSQVEVLVDPTMLLMSEEWDSLVKKPKRFNLKKKYILTYFLGDLSKNRRSEIERIAKENKCEIINIMDKKDKFFVCDPNEFLWLEKHAFLICTDSFHSSVFAILFNRPFVLFEREQVCVENMNSRLETLINKFKLKNRMFEGKITEENLNHDYSEAYKILEEERKKAEIFLRKALNIKK